MLSFSSLPCIRMMHSRAVGQTLCARCNPCLGYPGLRPSFYKRTGGVLKFACLQLG